MRPTGNPLSKIIIINDYPTAADKKKGIPFSDGCGQTMMRWLASNNLSMRDCYIITFDANKDLCTKKENTKGTFLYNQGLVCYNSSFLQKKEDLINLLDQCSPQVIICTGNASLFAITGKYGISKYRGSILRATFDTSDGKPYEAKVIPTVHPITTYRNPISHYYALNDIAKVYRELNFYEQHDWYTPKTNIKPTLIEALSYLDQCASSELVAFDIETIRTRKDPNGFVDWEMSCFSISNKEGEAMCISFLDSMSKNKWTVEEEALIFRKLGVILEDETITKVIQNAMFDASFLMQKHGIKTRTIEDTMIAQAILTPDFDKNLGFLCSLYTRESYYKDDGKQHIKQGGGKWDSFLEYSAKDSACLLEIHRKQMQSLTDMNNLETYQAQRDLLQPLLFMAYYGIYVDKDLLDMTSISMKREEETILKRIQTIVGEPINPNSTKQLKDYFYGKLGVKPTKNRKTGATTLNTKALKQLASKYEIASLIIQLRKIGKLRGTYMDVTLDKDNRLRTSFNPVGTLFGRLSSSKTIFKTGGNFQNQPPAFKSRLYADEGYFIVNVDLAQAENRLVAAFGPDHRMLEAFNSGISLHSQTGAMIASAMCGREISWEQIEADNKALEKADETGADTSQYTAPIGPGNKSWRHWGKTANHALNYDLSAGGFAEANEIDIKQATEIKKIYLQTYPGVRSYHEWVKHELRTAKCLTNPFGRKIRLFGKAGDDLYRQGYASMPQSTVADIINRFGLIPIYYEQHNYYSFTLLSQVHDSIVFQVDKNIPPEIVQTQLIRLKESLEQPIPFRGRTIVIPADFKAGSNLGRLKPLDINNIESVRSFYES